MDDNIRNKVENLEIRMKAVENLINVQESSIEVFAEADARPASNSSPNRTRFIEENNFIKPKRISNDVATSKSDFETDIYDFSSEQKGCFLILDIRNDEQSCCDAENLKLLGKFLGFKFVSIRTFNKTKKEKKLEMKEFLEKIGRASHEKYSCFFMFVLARCENASSQLHSFFDINADNCEFKLDDIIQPFLGCNAQTLAGKPKVIFIHAPELSRAKITTEVDAVSEIKKELPNHSDFLLCVSRPKETNAYDDSNCSYFVSMFCSIFFQYSSLEINDIMTLLCREINNKKELQNIKDENNLFWCRSQLTKKLFMKNNNKVEN